MGQSQVKLPLTSGSRMILLHDSLSTLTYRAHESDIHWRITNWYHLKCGPDWLKSMLKWRWQTQINSQQVSSSTIYESWSFRDGLHQQDETNGWRTQVCQRWGHRPATHSKNTANTIPKLSLFSLSMGQCASNRPNHYKLDGKTTNWIVKNKNQVQRTGLWRRGLHCKQ